MCTKWNIWRILEINLKLAVRHSFLILFRLKKKGQNNENSKMPKKTDFTQTNSVMRQDRCFSTFSQREIFSQMLDSEWTAKNFKKSANCTQSNRTRSFWSVIWILTNLQFTEMFSLLSIFDRVDNWKICIALFITWFCEKRISNFHEFFNRSDCLVKK